MQQKGNRFGAVLVAIVLGIGALGVVVAQRSGDSLRTRNAAIQAGIACKRQGQTQTVGAQRFLCGMSKGAKVWFPVRATQTALKPCTSLGAAKMQKGISFVCATVGKKKVWLAVVLLQSSVKENNANATTESSTTIPTNGNNAGANPVVNVDVSKSEAPVATPIGIRMAIQPSGALNGEPFAQVAVVQLRDEKGKDVALAGVRVEAVLLGAQQNVIDTNVKNAQVTTDAQGRATFSDLSITGQVGTYEILFIPSGLAGVISNFVELAPGVPNALRMARQPWGARTGDVLNQQPRVEVLDMSGNVAVSGTGKQVVVEVVGAGRVSSTVSTSRVEINADGVANFSQLSIAGTAGLYQLKFSSPGVQSVVSQSFAISSGDAAAVRMVTAASGAASGQAFTQQPVVETYDAEGNLIREAGWVITASVANGDVTLKNASATTDDAGRATFTNLSASGKVGNFAIAYSVKNGRDIVSAVENDAIALTAGEAAKLMMVQQPVDMPSGGTMGVSPEAQIADYWGNPTTVDITVRVNLSGTQLTRQRDRNLESWKIDIAPNKDGKVRLESPSFTGTSQSLEFVFSAGSQLEVVVSDKFVLTPGVPTQLDIAAPTAMPSGSLIAESGTTHRLSAQLRDSFGNLVDNVPYPVHASVVESNGAWLHGYPHAVSRNGFVVFPAVKMYGVTDGTVTIIISVGNLFDSRSLALTVSSDAKVGDPGPSTGTIFFDKKSATASSVSLDAQKFANLPFRYLEEAPLDAEESKTFYRIDKPAIAPNTEKNFGTGSENSSILQNFEINFGTYVAARYANDLSVSSTNGVFDNWFLPSQQEMETLLKSLPEEHSGKIYWTSSLSGQLSASTVMLSTAPKNLVLEALTAVSLSQLVRPIRAISFAPATPTNVTATATSVSNATLQFTQPSSPLSGDIQYVVTPTPAASITTLQNSDGSLVISGLASATSYTFSLTAVAAYGRSASSQSSVAIVTAPLPPTNLQAYSFSPGSLAIYCSSPSSGAGVNVTVEVASGLSGFIVQRTSACSFTVFGVPSASVYNIALVSRVGSVVSSAATIQYGMPPLAPTNLVGSANTNGILSFTFTAPPSNGAPIYYSLKQSGPTFVSQWIIQGQRITINGLQRGGMYTFALLAYVVIQSRVVFSPYSSDLVVRVP